MIIVKFIKRLHFQSCICLISRMEGASRHKFENGEIIPDIDPKGKRSNLPFMRSYTAIIKRSDVWWIGWIEELPGINCQGATREELIDNLSSALREAIEMHREEAIAAAEGDYQEETLVL